MFLFGHAGLTLLGKGTWNCLRKKEALWNRPREVVLVIAFSLLPDLVDKPLSLWLWPDPPSTRLIGHALAFWIIFWGGLQTFAPRIARWTWVPLLHLFLDQMWQSPHTLLFPLLGWQMDPGFSQELSFWELLRWNIYLYSSHWGLLIPELAGLAYLAYLGVRLSLRAQAGRIGTRIPQPPSWTLPS